MWQPYIQYSTAFSGIYSVEQVLIIHSEHSRVISLLCTHCTLIKYRSDLLKTMVLDLFSKISNASTDKISGVSVF